jgi:hypothetical protein
MDWTKQAEEMFTTWTETQKKMWDNWLETVQKGTGQNPAADVWQKTVDTWQDTVNNMLAAQGTWTDTWAESFDAQNGTPEEMAEWVKQTQAMAKQWSDAQQQMWANWFEMMKKADMGQMTGNWQEESKKAFTNWQDSTQKIMDAQMQWLKMWAPEAKK